MRLLYRVQSLVKLDVDQKSVSPGTFISAVRPFMTLQMGFLEESSLTVFTLMRFLLKSGFSGVTSEKLCLRFPTFTAPVRPLIGVNTQMFLQTRSMVEAHLAVRALVQSFSCVDSLSPFGAEIPVALAAMERFFHCVSSCKILG